MRKEPIIPVTDIERLVEAIHQANRYYYSQANRQVNTALTLRNWMIGYYIVEYEQKGVDRAQYGQRLFKQLAQRLEKFKIKGLSFTSLHLCKKLYITYPQVYSIASEQLNLPRISEKKIVQSVTEQLRGIQPTPARDLLNNFSFTHLVELIKVEEPVKRLFYETEALRNSWSVRELHRAMNSMLYERTGLSGNKEEMLEQYRRSGRLRPTDVFRSPYILDFLGISEHSAYYESDLEQAIIDHLHSFLLELGRGFCFEARQKRITFDNTHYRIDLVFYHRILKSHILLDIKLGEFSHADAGQMNVYLNYYQENEGSDGDSPPVGIILCAGKNDALVKYATAGLPQQVFVSKYLINLPTEEELAKIIKEEQSKIY